MFTIVAPTASLSLDCQFIKTPAATFFVAVENDGMAERGILTGDNGLALARQGAGGDGGR